MAAFDPPKPDDVIITIRVPRDVAVGTVSPKTPSDILAMTKMCITSYDNEDNPALATECVISMIVAQENEAQIISMIDEYPDNEVEQITAEKEAATREKFPLFEQNKENAEDRRLE